MGDMGDTGDRGKRRSIIKNILIFFIGFIVGFLINIISRRR
ncbi:hypothetical protein [Clostridium mobile]|nr:hypothetical protein [Clostridium mobile]